MSERLEELMMDVRERVIRIEERISPIPELETKVEKHEAEMIKSRTERKIIRWFAGLIFVTIPASVYAMVRVFKG